MPSIPYERLVDLAEGRLAASEAAELRAQIAQDPAMRAELSALEALIALMRSDESSDAPEHVLNRAIRLMPARTPRGAGILRQLIASLVQDSWQAPQLAAGLRSTARWPRSLLLQAGDRELDLQIGPSGEHWQLAGQVLGPEAPGTVILSGAAGQLSATLNDLGEFVFPPVSAGRYRLTLSQDDVEVIVPDLEIGPPARL